MTDDEIRDFLAWDGSGIDPEDFPSSLDGDLVELSPDRGVCFRGTAGGAAGWLDQHAKGPHSNFAFHARPRWTATTWGACVMRPVCATCRCEMRPKQNDFIVEEMADAERPYRLWATDLIRSPTRKRLVDALEIMVRCWDRSIDPADLVTQFGAQVAYTKAQFQRMRDVADYDLKRRIVERNRLEDLKLWPEYIEGRWSA